LRRPGLAFACLTDIVKRRFVRRPSGRKSPSVCRGVTLNPPHDDGPADRGPRTDLEKLVFLCRCCVRSDPDGHRQ
jgi:hypothetical protein